MVAIYGGLWFENLVKQDAHFELQCRLFERGVTQGIQMRVAHPSYTPGVTENDLPAIAKRLPTGMPVFVHYGAENCGVDFGEMLDECAVYAKRGRPSGASWARWNSESIAWGMCVADACTRPSGIPHGVAHLGYGMSDYDAHARERMVQMLHHLDDGSRIAIENVPALCRSGWCVAIGGSPTAWSRDHFWGFGGTPKDMQRHLDVLGPAWRCLIDFTHFQVTRNQAAAGFGGVSLEHCRTVEQVVTDALALPHWPICHFSGIPPTLMDSSDHMDAPVCEPIRDAIRTMDVVCLEIPFRPWSAERIIEDFHTRYLANEQERYF